MFYMIFFADESAYRALVVQIEMLDKLMEKYKVILYVFPSNNVDTVIQEKSRNKMINLLKPGPMEDVGDV